MSDYSARIGVLQRKMQADHTALTLLAGTDQMRYLTGWREGGHERFVGLFVPAHGEPAFVVPAMNAPQAKETPAGITQVLGWSDETGPHESLKHLFSQFGIKPGTLVRVDDELLSVHLLGLQSLFPGVVFSSAGEQMAELRQTKTAAELTALETAARWIDEIFEAVVMQLREGIRETEVADRVMAEIKVRGSIPSFPPLVCFGENAALPHHHTGDRSLRPGDVVILDIGCVFDHYASDITRTVSFGEPADPEARKVYEIVYRAHRAVIEGVKPETTGEEADALARNVITRAGYGDFFVHRTGHGIGLSTHESPYLVKGNRQPLSAGMCFSNEPGIYLPGRFGVRIENIVTLTETGLRSLNADAEPTLRVLTPQPGLIGF